MHHSLTQRHKRIIFVYMPISCSIKFNYKILFPFVNIYDNTAIAIIFLLLVSEEWKVA